MAPANRPTLVATFFWTALLALLLFFFVCEIRHASLKTFWGDEQFAWNECIRLQSAWALVRDGASQQASLAPLDYLLVMALDEMRNTVGYFGLLPNVYFRLVSILSTVLSAFTVGFLAWRSLRQESVAPSPFRLVLVLYALFSFLFTVTTYLYAIEMRPYALWNALWFAVCALFLYRPESKALIFVLLLAMALTASGSIFQFAALGAAAWSLDVFTGGNWRKSMVRNLAIFIPPLLLALVYSHTKGGLTYAGEEGQSWSAFLSYMFGNEYVPVLTVVAVAFCLLNRKTRRDAFPSWALLILYSMGPLIFFITHSSGMFFANRQYIYYNTAIPFFFLVATKVYPSLQDRFPKPAQRRALAGFILLLMGVSYAGYFHGRIVTALEHVRLDRPFGFFRDSEDRLANLLLKELPAGFCLNLGEYRADADLGTRMLIEWLPVQHPHLPVGEQTIFIEKREGTWSVVDVAMRTCPETYLPMRLRTAL